MRRGRCSPNRTGVADLGPERNAFPLRVADGATVGLSGAGVGSVPLAFRYRLAASLVGGRAVGNGERRAPAYSSHTTRARGSIADS